MKNFLQVNQFLGMVGSPNQTSETLTRENRFGLMSYLRRTIMLLFAVLVMSIANVGTAWGAMKALYDGTADVTVGFRNDEYASGNWSASTKDAQQTYKKGDSNNTFRVISIGSNISFQQTTDEGQYGLKLGKGSGNGGALCFYVSAKCGFRIAASVNGNNQTLYLYKDASEYSLTSSNYAEEGTEIAAVFYPTKTTQQAFSGVLESGYYRIASGANRIWIDTIKLTSYIPVTSISISPSPAQVTIGRRIQLEANVSPANASLKTVTWSVKSGGTYVSVDSKTGVVRGLAAGDAVITATANDGSGVTQDVNVSVTAINCDTYSGNLFQMEVLKVCTCTIASGSTYALTDGDNYSVYGGTLSLNNKGGSQIEIKSKVYNSLLQWYLNTGNVGYDITLADCNFKKGDIISISSTESNELYLNDGSAKGTSTDATTSSLSYTVDDGDAFIGKNRIVIWRGSTNTYIRSITISRTASSCEAPSSVSVAPTTEDGNYGWRYTTGETLKLTATATGGSGGSYTYQWKKKTGESTWKNLTDGVDATDGGTFSGTTSANLVISGLTSSNAGTYKCVVSTGAGCSTESNEFWVRVFTLNGNYSGSGFVENAIEWIDEFNGTATVTLNANSVYEFKVTDNDTHTFGLSSPDIYKDEDNFVIYGNDGNNVALHTGKVAGAYTFTCNVYYANDKSNPYVTLTAVRYPKMTIYMSGGSTTWCDANPVFFAHTYGQAPNDVMMSAHACETGLFYADVPSYNTKVTFTRQKTGSSSIAWSGDNFWNKSKDEIVIGSNNKFTCTGWDNKEGVFSGSSYSPSTYTISFAANGGSGEMSSISSIACDDDRAITANSFTKTGYDFAGWKANVDVTIDDETVTAGTVIADEKTIQNIRSNITLTAQWSVNSYDLTWNLGGGTTTSAGTGIESGVSSNTTSSIAFGTSLSAPTVTKTGYNFSSWSPLVASTMPAANTTYTAQWTANKYNVTHTLSHVTRSSGGEAGSNKATYGTAYSVVFAADGGYTLPDAVTVTVGGSDITANCTWDQGTGTLTIPAAYVTGNIVITVTGEEESSVGCSAEWGDWGSPVVNFPTNTSSTIPGDVDITLTTTLTAESTYHLGGGTRGSAYHFENGEYVDISINKGEITAVSVYTWNKCADVFRVQFFSTTSYDAEAVLGYQDFSGTGQNNTDLQVANAPAGSKFARISRVGGACFENYLYRLIVDAKTAPTLTALEDGVGYTPANMLPSGKTISTSWQYDAYGLSGNTKFYVIGAGGDESTAKAESGIPEIKTKSEDRITVSEVNYDNQLYFKGAANMSESTPTSRAIKFILPDEGKLTVYGSGSNIKLIKDGSASPTSISFTSNAWQSSNLSAGTYYMYATAGSQRIVYIRFDATAATYSIAYDCDGATSGCPSNVAEATNLPNPLPDAPVKTGYVFGGWYTNSGKTTPAVAGAALTGNTTLYAKWTRDVKTASWGAPWGGTAIPNATTSTVNSVTLNACNSAKGTLWSQESYTMGNGDSVTINLASGYYISAVSTAALFDEYGGNTNKLYIQFNSQSTYTNSNYDLDDPITLGGDCYDSWGTLGSATPVSVSPIPSGAQSAKIYCEGNSASGNYLYRIIVEITAYDCTPSTVSFDGGGATSGTAPLSREVCGEFTLPGSGSLAKKGNTFAGWSDGVNNYNEGDTYSVTGNVTFTAQWNPFTVPAVTGLAVDEDFAITWNVPGKLDLSTASLSNSDPDYFIVYQEPAGSKSYNSSTEELTVTYTVNAEHQPGVAIPFTLANLESITYDYKGLRVFPAVVKSDGSTLYWDYDNIPTSDSWTRVTQTPTTIYPNEGIQNPLPAAKAITFSGNPLANKTNESFYIRNVFYHCTGMIDVDHVVLMRKEGSAATDTTEAGTSVLLYSGIMSHYTDESVVKGKTYYYTVFSVHADGTLSAGTTQSVVVPKDDLDITYAAGTASSVTHNSATLPFTMSATTGVASVTLKVYKNSDNSLVNTIEGVTAATSGSGNVTGLDAETTYYFTVTPIGDATHNDGTESGKSATFTTSAAPTLSALVAGTLYEVPDMIPSGASLTSDDQFFEGLSANTKFTLIGSASSSTTPKVNNKSSNDRTIAGITFDDGSMWFKGNATVSENIPSTFGLSFIVPSAGKLYLYFDDDDASTNIKLAKSGTSGSKPTVSSGYSVVDVTSGTYYMYGTSTSAPYSFYGLKFIPTYAITLHDNNGGDNNGSAAVAVNGTTLLDIDAPTRSGYAVTGYYAEAECTTPVADAEGNLEANVTVSAVDWTDGDGKWIKGSGATLYAKWGVVYTVTFNTNGGSSVDAITQTSEGASITMPAAPTKDGYTFNGWQIGSTYAAGASYTPTANVTAYATWKAECGVIKWDFTNRTEATLTANKTTSYTADDGVTEMRYSAGSSDKIVAYDSKKSIDGHLYENGNTGSGTVYDIDDITNVGKTRLIRLFVEPGSGTLRINCNGDQNGVYKVLDGSASGTTLISSLSANTTSSSITLTTSPLWIETTTKGYINDIRWTPSSTVCYYVTYNGNGADGGYVNDPEQYASGANPEVLDCGYTRTGYAFMGWADGTDHRDAGTVDYQPGNHITSISDDVTLYAIWKQIKYFIGAASTTSWNTDGNWSPSGVPAITDPVVIQEDVTVDTDEAQALSVDIESGNTLTINAGQALIIEKTLTKAGGATAATDVIINSTRAAGTGALVIGGETGTNKATVNFETKVKRESGTGNWINQFIGSPFSDLEPYVDYALQIYAFKADGSGNRGYWHSLSEGNEMEEFVGHNILYNDNNFLDVQWTGTLNASSNDLTLTGYYGSNTYSLFANSWVAPIHIGSFESTDFANMDATIYIFNAGTPQQEKEMGAGNGAKTDAGTYAVIPISSGEWIEGTLDVIPAMQAFFVKANAASPSLTLDYLKLVYTPALTSVGITPTRAPRRATAEEAPEVIRLRVTGENGWAETTYLLGREDFTEGFDNGWDGRYMEGEDTNPQLYAPTGDGNMAVNCVPQIEGTVLGFRKGNADSQYTFSFEYAGEEEYYLKDLKLDIETRIDNESTYAFTAEAGDNAARFIIVRKTPAVATGVDNVDGEGAKVRKLIINDKVYIIRGGRIYSVDGALVK